MLYRLSYAPARTLGTLYRITGDIPVSDIKAAHIDRLLASLRRPVVPENVIPAEPNTSRAELA